MTSLNETAKLIENSRKLVDIAENVEQNPNSILNLFLDFATSIDTSMKRLESNIETRLENMRQDFLSVSARVRTLENQCVDFS